MLLQVALTDVHESWMVNVLQGVQVGSFVRAALLQHAPCLLSLRAGDGALWGAPPAPTPAEVDGSVPTTLDVATFKVGHAARGYVKAVTKAGVFVVLARNVEARVRLSQLQNGFVEDPAAAFPVGSLFTGRVVSTDGGRYVDGLLTLMFSYASQAGAVCADVDPHPGPLAPVGRAGGAGQGGPSAAVWRVCDARGGRCHWACAHQRVR